MRNVETADIHLRLLSSFDNNTWVMHAQTTTTITNRWKKNNLKDKKYYKCKKMSFIEVQRSLLTLETASNLFNVRNSYSYYMSFIHRSIRTVADRSLLILDFLLQFEKILPLC